MYSIIKKPSAWIPILVTLFFLVYLLVCLNFFEIVREEDEGVGAHLFQLWLVLEPFMIGFFAFRWLRQSPKDALLILLLQIFLAILPIYMVFSLKL